MLKALKARHIISNAVQGDNVTGCNVTGNNVTGYNVTGYDVTGNNVAGYNENAMMRFQNISSYLTATLQCHVSTKRHRLKLAGIKITDLVVTSFRISHLLSQKLTTSFLYMMKLCH